MNKLFHLKTRVHEKLYFVIKMHDLFFLQMQTLSLSFVFSFWLMEYLQVLEYQAKVLRFNICLILQDKKTFKLYMKSLDFRIRNKIICII